MAQLRNSQFCIGLIHGPFQKRGPFLGVETAIYFYYGVFSIIKKRIYIHKQWSPLLSTAGSYAILKHDFQVWQVCFVYGPINWKTPRGMVYTIVQC